MEDIVANVSTQTFDIENALEEQLGAHPLPFPGMDKSGAAVCNFFLRAMCSKGTACPFRHVSGDRTVVCKHWLRGLCKKGDDCEFLHEYDMSKMPECYFFSKFGQCSNKECPFLHIDPEKKVKDCAWYDRGFCRHGPNCKNRHVRRVMCQNYLCGFCPEGPKCKYVHPSFSIPGPDPVLAAKKANIQCHFCNELGHKAINCPNMPSDMKADQENVHGHGPSGPHMRNMHNSGGPNRILTTDGNMEQKERQPRRPLDEVTCYKCNGKGHYANRCPKGHLAFLSHPVPQDSM